MVDTTIPPSAHKIHGALVRTWPRLADRVVYFSAAIADVDLRADDVVVSSHACGALTDHIIARAVGARARVAVLPCCHDADSCDAGALGGWLDTAMAIDVTRAVGLAGHGYRVWTQTIPEAITPKNRLLVGAPD